MAEITIEEVIQDCLVLPDNVGPACEQLRAAGYKDIDILVWIQQSRKPELLRDFEEYLSLDWPGPE